MERVEYERLKQQAHDECKKKLDAIEMVWRLSQNGQTHSKPEKQAPCPRVSLDFRKRPSQKVPFGKPAGKSMVELVRDECKNMDDEFTTRNVIDNLIDLHPELAGRAAAIKKAVHTLHSRGLIQVTATRPGGQGNIYRVT